MLALALALALCCAVLCCAVLCCAVQRRCRGGGGAVVAGGIAAGCGKAGMSCLEQGQGGGDWRCSSGRGPSRVAPSASPPLCTHTRTHTRTLSPAPPRACVQEAGAKPGRAVSAFFGYMKGVKNELAMKHVPEVVPRNDTLAGPKGRRGDMVGGFTLMHREDLRRVAPLWLKYTEDVRFDPDVRARAGGGAGERGTGGEGSCVVLLLCSAAVTRQGRGVGCGEGALHWPLRLSQAFSSRPPPSAPAPSPGVQAWELSGDAYSTHKGDRPWISEMYGYSYGCAKADVWHLVHRTAMLYPGYDVSGVRGGGGGGGGGGVR